MLLEGLLQRPHLFVGVLVVQRPAVRSRDYQGQRIRSAVAVDVFQSVAQRPMWFEVLQQARIGIEPRQADAKRDARHDDGD